MTLLTNSNIGNRLQNYALQSVLRGDGHDVSTLPVEPWRSADYSLGDQWWDLAVERARRARGLGPWGSMRLAAQTAEARLTRRPSDDLDRLRREALEAFTRDRIPLSPHHIWGPGDGEAVAEHYDVFVVGSDQVWNPDLTLCCPTYFLTFAPIAKRVAYAPSFGLSTLPPRAARTTKGWLAEIPRLSVREESGATLIRRLAGRDVPVVLDPTMIIGTGQWTALAHETEAVAQGPSIAHCFLTQPPRQRLREIEQLGERNGFQVIDVLRPQAPSLSNTGVQAFVRAILDADLVLTDSFHATVFSILLERPFLAFPKGRRSSRIQSLLGLTQLDDRLVESVPRMIPPAPSWEHARRAVARERARSLGFLLEAVRHA